MFIDFVDLVPDICDGCGIGSFELKQFIPPNMPSGYFYLFCDDCFNSVMCDTELAETEFVGSVR